MYSYSIDLLVHMGSIVLGIDGQFLQFIQGIESIDHTAKERVLQVKIWLGGIGNEELAGIGVGSVVGHGNHSSISVLKN